MRGREAESLEENTIKDNIKKERNRLRKIVKKAPENRAKLHEMLIDRAAFMYASLKYMEEKILSDGYVTEMSQGTYTIDRAHPLLDKYNAMVKNYITATKQLDSMSGDTAETPAGNAVMQFAVKK